MCSRPLRSPAIGSPPATTEPNDPQGGGTTGSRPEALLDRWRDAGRVQKYGAIQGWIDTGERLALVSVADDVRGRRVLDLGVGAGRTSWLLRLLTDEYVGLDWSPEMAAACREAFPGLDVRAGDARDLATFDDGRFALVVFSYNGIDNLDHEGRGRVITEAARVLEPGGYFVYSTLSKTGLAYQVRPSLQARRRPGEGVVRHAARALYHLGSSAGTYRRDLARWRQGMARATDHGTWATGPLAALDHELVHFTTVHAERDALATNGLDVVRLFTDDGRALETDGAGYSWFHVVARKRPGTGAPMRPV
jgi:SAM-dependent methyltransferase